MKPNRHDLVFLSPRGQRYAWEHRAWTGPTSPAARDLFPLLPGICRTRPPDLEAGLAALGFSFPIREGEGRIRLSAQAPEGEIVRLITPWEIPGLGDSLPAPWADALKELAEEADALGLSLGVFGSAALQAVTGLPYLHARSDLDVLLAAAPADQMRRFYRALVRLSEGWGLGVDAELMLGESRYVKLSELMGGSKTILAKGGPVPRLLSSQLIWDTMAEMPK